MRRVHPKHYRFLVADSLDYTEGVSPTVSCDHRRGCITVARNAPVERIIPELLATLHEAYARAGLAVVPVLGHISTYPLPN